MRSRLARLLGAELRPGEGRVVALFAFDLFLLLTAYYVLKVVREPLILLEGGALERSYARGAQALLLTALVPAYSFLVNRTGPRQMVNWLNASFIVALVAFWALSGVRVHVGFAFFVWLGIFSTLSIAQFWSLLNDLFSEEQGKRMFPFIAVGGTFGAIGGAQLSARLSGAVSPTLLMLFSAGILSLYLAIGAAATRFAAHGARTGEQEPQAMSSTGGFRLVVTDRYLTLIGASVVTLNLINSNGEYILADLVTTAVRTRTSDPSISAAFIASFYGDFQTWVSVLTATVQLFAVARIFRYAGVHRAILFLPLFAFGGYGVLAAFATMRVAGAVKIVENASDYSLQNTVHQTLFLPTSRDAKYKAKAATDTLFVRLGDLGSTAVVFVGVHSGLTASGFSVFNSVAAIAWTGIALALGRGYRDRASPAAHERAVA